MVLYIATVVGAANDKFTLVIDAGHGGNDAGALGKFSKEKNINLKVALAFGRYVERNCSDVKVIYTRKTDVFIPLHQRADIANRNKADLFISIHTNALPGKRIARGLETYTLGMNRAADNFDVAKRENSVILIEKDYKQRYQGFDPNSSESYIMFEFLQDKNMEQSVELAKAVQKRTCATANRPNKGVKQAGFLVLRETSMPSCLIELGFITTPDEEKFLNSESGADALGKGIYQAFVDYKKKYGKNKTATSNSSEPRKERNETPAEKKDTKPKTKSTNTVPAEITAKKERKQEKRDSKSIMAELVNARNGVAPEKQKESRFAEVEEMAEDSTSDVTSPDTQQQKAQTDKEPTTKTVQETATRIETLANNIPETPQENTVAPNDDVNERPIFKVQILASDIKLNTKDKQLKNLEGVEIYQENGLYKYTVGASADYNEIYRLRKSIVEKFPEAFIIAFKNGQKTNVAEAIREFKSNRNKK